MKLRLLQIRNFSSNRNSEHLKLVSTLSIRWCKCDASFAPAKCRFTLCSKSMEDFDGKVSIGNLLSWNAKHPKCKSIGAVVVLAEVCTESKSPWTNLVGFQRQCFSEIKYFSAENNILFRRKPCPPGERVKASLKVTMITQRDENTFQSNNFHNYIRRIIFQHHDSIHQHLYRQIFLANWNLWPFSIELPSWKIFICFELGF